MLEQTITIVLAEGSGEGLEPLVQERPKAAIPFGGKYRIIDFVLGNCLHSGLRRVLVPTQYKSHSLQKHLRDGWSIFNPELGEYITPVPSQMRLGYAGYKSDADAVFQNFYMLERSGAKHVVILRGDHIYRMDYAAVLNAHVSNKSDLTEVVTDTANGSLHMGIYIFSLPVLKDVLVQHHLDIEYGKWFAKDIIPDMREKYSVSTYLFGSSEGRVSQDKYWNSIESLDDLYQANMELLEPEPALDIYQQDWPVRTYQKQLPPARTVPGPAGNEGIFINSISGDGTVITGGSVQHSVLFPQVSVCDDAVIEDSVLFDDVVIGKGVKIRNCIIDKGVCVPDKFVLGHNRNTDSQMFKITDNGIVIIPKGFDFTKS